MAVAKDATLSGGAAYSSLSSSSYSNTSMTLGSSATALAVLIVTANATSGGVIAISSVTCNGTTMPLVATTGVNVTSNAAAYNQVSVYGLANPPTGNVTIVVNFASTPSSMDLYLDAISFTGTDTTTPFPSGGTHTDTSASTTVYPTSPISITTVVGDAICGVESCYATTVPGETSTGGTAIQISNNHAGTYCNFNDAYTLATATPTTLQWTSMTNPDITQSVVFRVKKPGPYGFLQTNQTNASTSVAYSSAVTPGSTLVAAYREGDTGVTLSVSDSVNGTWTVAGQWLDLAGDTVLVAYYQNTAAGTPTVSIGGSGAGTHRLIILEYGGVAAVSVDQFAFNNNGGSGNNGTSAPTPSVTTTYPNEILISFLDTGNGNASSDNGAGSNPSSGWTYRNALDSSGGPKIAVEDVIVTSTGTYQEYYNLSVTDTWTTAILTLKQASTSLSLLPKKLVMM